MSLYSHTLLPEAFCQRMEFSEYPYDQFMVHFIKERHGTDVGFVSVPVDELASLYPELMRNASVDLYTDEGIRGTMETFLNAIAACYESLIRCMDERPANIGGIAFVSGQHIQEEGFRLDPTDVLRPESPEFSVFMLMMLHSCHHGVPSPIFEGPGNIHKNRNASQMAQEYLMLYLKGVADNGMDVRNDLNLSEFLFDTVPTEYEDSESFTKTYTYQNHDVPDYIETAVDWEEATRELFNGGDVDHLVHAEKLDGTLVIFE